MTSRKIRIETVYNVGPKFCIYLSIYLTPEQQRFIANSLHNYFPIHSQIPGLPEAHAIQVPPELLGPAGPWALTRSLPNRIRCTTAANLKRGLESIVAGYQVARGPDF